VAARFQRADPLVLPFTGTLKTCRHNRWGGGSISCDEFVQVQEDAANSRPGAALKRIAALDLTWEHRCRSAWVVGQKGALPLVIRTETLFFARLGWTAQGQLKGTLDSVLDASVRLAQNTIGEGLGGLGEDRIVQQRQGLERSIGTLAPGADVGRCRGVERHALSERR